MSCVSPTTLRVKPSTDKEEKNRPTQSLRKFVSEARTCLKTMKKKKGREESEKETEIVVNSGVDFDNDSDDSRLLPALQGGKRDGWALFLCVS